MKIIFLLSEVVQDGNHFNLLVLIRLHGSIMHVGYFYQVLILFLIKIISLNYVGPTDQPTSAPTYKPANSTYVCSDFSHCCQGKNHVTFAISITRIPNEALKDCTNLQIVIIPSTVTSIGGKSFYGCSSLISLVISDTVVLIDSYAFYNCPFACIFWDLTIQRMISPVNAFPTTATCASNEFNYYNGNIQPYVVPNNVFQLKVDLYGASGGKGYPSDITGGEGGVISTFISVSPGQTLYLVVGGAGGNTGVKYGTGVGGYNGGGFASGSSYVGGGGGGCSDIRLATDITSRIVVAGGGGASGSDFGGGDGGGDIGANGSEVVGNEVCSTATGGSQSGPGLSVSSSEGSKGQGGNGAFAGREHVGGAGGCGYFGGGGGCIENGGAGGSSYSSQDITVTLINNKVGGNIGNGKIIVSYNQPGTLLITTSNHIYLIIINTIIPSTTS